MNSAFRKRAKSLFLEALDLPEARRAAFVEREAQPDVELARLVLELLRSHSQAGSFLGSPTLGAGEGATLPGEERAGERIGPYELLEPLGRGGFGVVWHARQLEPVRRDVALKIIKLGMDTKAVVARFELERQALAVMDHPHIARVFDAGATATGRPYFVMELVRGTAITKFCDEHSLSTKERLELFQLVCRAVQHAHQKGVIHRDIKPGNILVALEEGRPVPKVIDFGVAKATRADAPGAWLHTEQHQVIGTPEYMAPEQADRSGLDVDTRADVYSLGVVLYEMLTSTAPFDARMLRDRPWDEVVRTLREVEPEKPSTRVSTLEGETRRTALRARCTSDLPRILRGDLDWIVLKALEKDRTRRYETAQAFADDVQRHLADLPVLASPPSGLYRLRKYVRRNRIWFAASLLVAITLVAGIVATALALVEARARRNEALAEAAEARAELRTRRRVARFLGDMLTGAGPSVAQGRDATILREIIARTEAQLDGELAGDDDVRAGLLDVLGRAHRELGDLDRAIELGDEAVELWHRMRPDPDPDTALAEANLAAALLERGRLEDAEQHARSSVRIFALVPDADARDRATAHSNLGLVLVARGAMAEGERELRESLRIEREAHLESSPESWAGLDGLGEALRLQGRTAEAETLAREVLQGSIERLGPDHPRTLTARNALAVLRLDGGHAEEAETELRGILEHATRVHGATSPITAQAAENLALAEKRLGRLDDALRTYDAALRIYRAVSPRDWDATARALSRRASVLRQLERHEDALQSLDEAVAMFERLANRRDPEWPETLGARAEVRVVLRDAGGAEADLLRAIEIAGSLDAASRQTALLHNQLAGIHLSARRFPAAEAELELACDSLRRAAGADPLQLATIATNLTYARFANGKFATAVESGRLAVRLRTDHAAGDANVADSLYWLARALLHADEREEAWRTYLAHCEHSDAVPTASLEGRVERLRRQTLRAMEFREFDWARARCAEAIRLRAEEPDLAARSSLVAIQASLDSAREKPWEALADLRDCIAELETSQTDALSQSGMQLVLGGTLVDAAAARDDREAAQEARMVLSRVLEVRERLLKPGDWRVVFARAMAAAARGECALLAPEPGGLNRGGALREALGDLDAQVAAVLASDMPMPTRGLRMPVVLQTLSRLHESVGAFEGATEHGAAARAWRAQANTLRAQPLD